jgi:hypothetical protein
VITYTLISRRGKTAHFVSSFELGTHEEANAAEREQAKDETEEVWSRERRAGGPLAK